METAVGLLIGPLFLLLSVVALVRMRVGRINSPLGVLFYVCLGPMAILGFVYTAVSIVLITAMIIHD